MKLQPVFAPNFSIILLWWASSKRNFQGIKESEDEEAFFPQSSRNASHPLINSFRDYSQQQYQGIRDNPKISRQPVEQHCFILGTDFKSPKPNKADKEPENEKHLHHFFGEWPPKNTDSWLDLASNSRVPNGNHQSFLLLSLTCFYLSC